MFHYQVISLFRLLPDVLNVSLKRNKTILFARGDERERKVCREENERRRCRGADEGEGSFTAQVLLGMPHVSPPVTRLGGNPAT